MSAELPVLAVALAVIHLADAAACAIPIPILAREFDRLELSPGTRRAMPPVKLAAGAGLLLGLWAPWLGVLTSVALVVYFSLALGAHRRAQDPPKKYVNALGMLALTALTLMLTYLPAL